MPPHSSVPQRLLSATLRIPRLSYVLHCNSPTRTFSFSSKLANAQSTITDVEVEGYARYQFPENYDDREVWLFEGRATAPRPNVLNVSTISQLLTTPMAHGVYINPRNDWCKRLRLLNPQKIKIEYEVLPLEAQPMDQMQGRPLRQINFRCEDRPRDHARRMVKMYSFLEDNQHCMVHVQMPTKKLDWGLGPAFDWVVVNTPHLRPEVIIKSMPEGTSMEMVPHAGYGEVVWVFGRGESLNPTQIRRLKEKLMRSARKSKIGPEVESSENVKELSSE
ncbi:uncharacterized protein BDZ99DRAFT_259342 [Mytilinidion resinicola]|uniref:Uncharacterized protein n=1 Tax=Mytilinidion resinicola TaxID=574789 RepID=A0A6A6YXA9_9PEZI|nr:uncharacterized protein BDZ99DRAFT_259342 [Mytilinidion resinicola]KAF2813576.1 hypothetical protein BDZ99DRAFT_259342 [Mytilinidion resinicola]